MIKTTPTTPETLAELKTSESQIAAISKFTLEMAAVEDTTDILVIRARSLPEDADSVQLSLTSLHQNLGENEPQLKRKMAYGILITMAQHIWNDIAEDELLANTPTQAPRH